MSKTICAFGEMLLRLTTTSGNTIMEGKSFTYYFGGTEANVLIAASSLQQNTRFLSCFPSSPIGLAAKKHLLANNVDCSNLIFKGERLGVYYLNEGYGVLPSEVIYDRKNSAINCLKKDDFDLASFFKDASFFFVTGITLALSKEVYELALMLIKEAKKRNILVAFDFNYRKTLIDVETAKKNYQEVLPYVDICFGNEYDLKEFLNLTSDPIKEFFIKYSTKYLIYTNKETGTNDVNTISAVGYFFDNGIVKKIITKSYEFAVLERIGSGDAFAGGVLSVLNDDINSLSKALDYGVACAALKYSLFGDVFTLKEENIIELLTNDRMDVKR